MSDEKPYGDTYQTELNRLREAQNTAAENYTAHSLYLKHKLFMRDDALRTSRIAEAEAEWLRLDAAINALNAAEYRKKTA